MVKQRVFVTGSGGMRSLETTSIDGLFTVSQVLPLTSGEGVLSHLPKGKLQLLPSVIRYMSGTQAEFMAQRTAGLKARRKPSQRR